MNIEAPYAPVPPWVWALWRHHRTIIAAQVKEHPLAAAQREELRRLEAQLEAWVATRDEELQL